MDLVLCWLVAPAGLLLVCVGLSLLVERLAQLDLPWPARPALGVAAAIVLVQLGTASAASAELILPAIVVLAALGLLLGFGLPSRLPDRWETGIALAVFALFALPFVVHGDPTWAGYVKLDDSGTFMALSDHVFEHGRGVGQMPLSTHFRTVQENLGGSYPIGSFVPFALMAMITGQDVAFVFQPSMAFAAAAFALLLFELIRRLVSRAGFAAAIAILSTLSSLLLGYYLWGGVKELVTVALLGLGPVLAGAAAREGWPRFAWAPIAIAAAAVVAVLGPGGTVWVVPTLLPALVALALDRGLGAALRQAAPVAALGALLALPVVLTPSGWFSPLQGGLTDETELGNLLGPLNLLHVAGIWPALDFRVDPHLKPLTLGLAVGCLMLAASSVLACARLGGRGAGREGVPFAALCGGGAVGAGLIIVIGSPWVDAKAMATISPALLAGALLGIVMLGQRTGFKVEALAAGIVVSGAVVWSAVLAYQGIWFAPEDHYRELARIGERFAGEGPALSTEIAVYGPRHFLRELDDEGATELRYRQIYLRGGVSSTDGQFVDLDQIQPDQFDPYNLIVVRRSPYESRPSASFELAYAGTYYEVWRRVPAPGRLIAHLPLGNSLDAGAGVPCAETARLSRAAGAGGHLVAARVGRPYTVSFVSAAVPTTWSAGNESSVLASGSGALEQRFNLGAGRYELWVAGQVFGGLDVSIDGGQAGSERAIIENAGESEPLGEVALRGDRHRLELRYRSGGLEPGSADPPPELGPVRIGPVTLARPQRGDAGLVNLPASESGKLCGKRWDWIEAYR